MGHSFVVVLDGRQPACVLRLALQSPALLPFFALFPWIAIVYAGTAAVIDKIPGAFPCGPV